MLSKPISVRWEKCRWRSSKASLTLDVVPRRPRPITTDLGLTKSVGRQSSRGMGPGVRQNDESAMPEYRGPDTDMRGTELDRGREIGAHAHRQMLQAVARGDLRGQYEMWRRRLVHRRDAHQACDGEAITLAAACDEAIRLAGRDTRLLRLLAGVDLHEQFGALVLRIDFFG